MTLELKENEFVAIKVNQPFGEYFTVRLNAEFLLKRSYTKSANYDGGDISGAQRKIKRARLNEIGQFIDSNEALFPNSIIIAANFNKNDTLVEEDLRWKAEPIDEKSGVYKLTIPTDAKVCSVVDGQHRLFGFEYSVRKDMELSCSVYLDLPPSFQASVFATVNFNQSPVDKSLAYNLFGYQLDYLDPKDWSPDLLAINLCRYFSETKGEFFCGHINYRLSNRNVPSKYWVISTAAFVDGVMSLISESPKDDRYEVNRKSTIGIAGRKVLKDDSCYPLRSFYISRNDEAIRQIISEYFKALQRVFAVDDQSNIVLVKTIGISAFFILLRDILKRDKVDSQILSKFEGILRRAKEIDFENSNFYASSTKGKNRLISMLRHKVLEIPFEEMNLRSDQIAELKEEITRLGH
ncbi:DGQHR domain-containing protein [Alteromonas sp. S167]|uniref:DGQHR domain-containing protein n=1 Tax=Alteromonas sp. S167 TaxID=3117402 RepID=UPI002FDF1684